jgi:hypothetical protein
MLLGDAEVVMTPTSPRALVVYESIFGNTRQVAEAVARGLGTRFEVQVVEVSHAPAAPEGVALLVVGGPIHAFGMTREATRQDARKQAFEKGTPVVSPGPGVREWLAALAVEPGPRAAAAFDTGVKLGGWFVVGSAARGEAKALRAHGYAVVARPEHFLVGGIDGPLQEGELARAEAWGAAVAAAALAPPALAPPAEAAKPEAPGVAHLRLMS